MLKQTYTYEGHSINKGNLPKELAIRSIAFNCTFVLEINNDVFFNVPDDSQHDLLYWSLHQKLFLCWRLNEFSFHELVFLTQSHSAQCMFSPFVKNFLSKTCFSEVSRIRLMVCTSEPSKIWWQTSVKAWITLFDLKPFWIVSKQTFFTRLK